MNYDLDFAVNYLATGGLGETIGLTESARQMGNEKIQMSTDHAMALCLLADEALKSRKQAAT